MEQKTLDGLTSCVYADHIKSPTRKKQMMSETDFYYHNAGSSHYTEIETPEEGKYRGAEELTYARGQANQKGWYYEWDNDPEEPDWGDVNPSVDERLAVEHLMVVLRDQNGDLLTSMGGILDNFGSDYCKVIEAELAVEALKEKEGFTCASCGRTWLVPTPASRCPFEAHHSTVADLGSVMSVPIAFPGQVHDGRTVVASVYVEDETQEDYDNWMLIQLNDDAPFFRLAEFDGLTGKIVHHIGDFFNIVEAVREYESNGGDF